MTEDGVKILVIEDEPLVRESLKDNLETDCLSKTNFQIRSP